MQGFRCFPENTGEFLGNTYFYLYMGWEVIDLEPSNNINNSRRNSTLIFAPGFELAYKNMSQVKICYSLVIQNFRIAKQFSTVLQ